MYKGWYKMDLILCFIFTFSLSVSCRNNSNLNLITMYMYKLIHSTLVSCLWNFRQEKKCRFIGIHTALSKTVKSWQHISLHIQCNGIQLNCFLVPLVICDIRIKCNRLTHSLLRFCEIWWYLSRTDMTYQLKNISLAVWHLIMPWTFM